MRILKITGCFLLFVVGFACGAASFVRTQARPMPSVHQCRTAAECVTDPELLGLITSAGLHLAPGLMPEIVARSRECVGIRSPRPEARVDLVFFPTRDMRDALDIGPGDEKYLIGCFALMRKVVDERHLQNWRVFSNGAGRQEIAYLHFHLIED